jgi:hypothetical protein
MKKLLLLSLSILTFLTACKKEKEAEPKTRVIVDITKQNISASGEIIEKPTLAIIQIWSAEGSDFDINASPDIHVGYAFDKNTGSFKTINRGAIGSSMNERLAPGRYFVYVFLPKSSGKGSLAYSYTYFDIKQGETLKIVKTFSHSDCTGEFESWEKNTQK